MTDKTKLMYSYLDKLLDKAETEGNTINYLSMPYETIVKLAPKLTTTNGKLYYRDIEVKIAEPCPTMDLIHDILNADGKVLDLINKILNGDYDE